MRLYQSLKTYLKECVKMLVELNASQMRLIKEMFEEIDVYDIHQIVKALNNPIDISDTCPSCGCTEMLCGHNGSGCCHDNDEEEE